VERNLRGIKSGGEHIVGEHTAGDVERDNQIAAMRLQRAGVRVPRRFGQRNNQRGECAELEGDRFFPILGTFFCTSEFYGGFVLLTA